MPSPNSTNNTKVKETRKIAGFGGAETSFSAWERVIEIMDLGVYKEQMSNVSDVSYVEVSVDEPVFDWREI